MKAYFEPKMNISVFDTDDVITTSQGGGAPVQPVGNQYGVVNYNDLRGKGTVEASTASMTD